MSHPNPLFPRPLARWWRAAALLACGTLLSLAACGSDEAPAGGVQEKPAPPAGAREQPPTTQPDQGERPDPTKAPSGPVGGSFGGSTLGG